MESPMQETIYGTNSDDSHVMSEKVQSLASNIYQELERMIEKYDEDVVKELMPLVVNVLESLDSAVMDNQEHEVELELLREDNEQLVTQYEREKQLRKSAEQRLLEIEYSTDDDRRNLLAKVESLESIVRMLELKAKNSSDHASRLEEKDSEMKKEYAILHERYTELFKTHMDYMERTKILFGPDKLEVLNTKTRPLHFPHTKSNITSFVSPQEVGSNILSSPADVPSLVSPNQSSDSNASLKSEIQEVAYSTVATSPRRKSGSKGKEKSVTEKGQITDRITLSDRSTGTRDGWVDDLDANLNDALVTTPEMDEIEEMDGYNFDLDNSTMKSERHRPNTLYEELSFQDNDALGDLEEGADISGGYARRRDYASSESDGESEREHKVNDSIFGMGKEVENLISENNELLATKNALNVVKDDLIAKVDELTSEQEILREELKQYMSVKEKLKQRISELEEELKKAKEAAEKSKSGKSDDEEELPMAQRKRFTRVEMARVLMERNQYKERLMELQEAVRWTEMIRASRSDSSLDTKRNKSSIWKFFSNLFNANEKPPRKSMPFVNVHYNAPTTSSGPALDTMRKKRLGDRHRGLDILDSDLVSEKLQQQRARERREQYKQVRAHVRKEDGRLQAYGWSLPSRTSSTVKNTETETATQAKAHNSSVPVPVPVFCRPLLEKEIGMKVWCAAGVDLTGGKPESSNVSVVGSSLFYVTSADEVTKLNDELKEYEKHRKEQMLMERNLSSYVWLCTSTHTTSKVTVIDANNPAEILDSFQVCSSHLLCIASIPGTKSSDYPVDEEFLKMGKRESSMDCSDTEPGKAGDLLYISIAAETACDSSASTPVNKDSSIESAQNNVIEETKYIDEDSNRISSSFAQNSKDDLPSSHPLSESFENVSSSPDKPNHDIQQTEKMSSVLPTMWLGSQGGHIYVHSSVAQWWCCINSVKLRDSVLSIVHMRGRVFAGLADGSVAIFHRGSDGEWDLLNFHLLDLGRPLYSVRCMTIVDKYVWCGYRNCIHVVDTESLAVVETFDAHPRKESQVRQMAWIEDGVWVTIRLDSTLRLYHAHTRQHLQDVDIEPYVSKMLGTGKLGFSFVRITALLISCKRLWMGTGNGVIISVPLTEEKVQRASSDSSGRAPGSVVRVYSDIGDSLHKSGFIPYCSMAQAQLSFHGHRDAVKFFVAVPGFAASSKIGSDQDGKDMQSEIKQAVSRNKETGQKPDCMLILSGGEGYIDFRIGDGEEDETLASLTPDSDERRPVALVKGDRSHLIVWQVALAD